MKIGIVGGTFDPIHNGHLMLGEYAYEELGLDEIWFMPNGNPPHKCNKSMTSTPSERVEMIERAIRSTKYFKLSKHEIDKEKTTFTYETLSELGCLYPNDTFYFILGSDSLFSIEHWKHPEIIFKKCKILAACRENMNFEILKNQINYIKEKYNADVKLLQMPLLEISSSSIRQRIAQGKSIRFITPVEVIQYIEEFHIYKS